jgi:glycosyltransferase involved in cell wall biosynthesis
MRNEADSIASCVASMLAQDYPAERFEVILIDGASDDRTRDVVGELMRGDSRIRLLDNPRRIVPTAMNIGIRSARGEIVARVDGHTHIAEDYLSTGVAVLERTGADNVGGPMHAVGGGWFGDAVAAATSSRFGIGSYFHFGTEEREVDTVYLGMWPRRAFEKVGLFDEELVRNQDDELNYRIRKAGGRVVLTPRMRSWYQNRTGFRRLVRQYFQYGEWKVRVLQKHPLQMSWRHFVPPAFVAALFSLSALGTFSALARAAAAALAATYLAAVVAAAWGSGKGARARLAAALAFVAIHLSWGAGFLIGLVKFAGRWRVAETAPPTLERVELPVLGSNEPVPAGDQEALRRSI